MKVWRIFWKSLKEQIRDWRFLAYALLSPVLFMVIFGLAFSGSFYTYKIAVINNDGAGGVYSEALIETLEEVRYDAETKIFQFVPVASQAEAKEKAMTHQITGYLVIPEEFSEKLTAGSADIRAVKESGIVTLHGDPGYAPFGLVESLFRGVFFDFVQATLDVAMPVVAQPVYLGVQETSSEFDYLAPGIMLMAIYFLIIQAAVVLMREIQSKTLTRLQLARLSTWKYLTGVGGTQILFSAIMIPVMFGTAVMMGFNLNGSLLAGVIIGVATCISAIALGLITAAFSKTVGEAFLIGNVVLVPVVFLSGVFFPLPENGLFHLFGRDINLFMLQPATHAVNAFQRLFLYGGGLQDVLFELIAILLLSSLFFLIGIVLFRQAHFRSRIKKRRA